MERLLHQIAGNATMFVTQVIMIICVEWSSLPPQAAVGIPVGRTVIYISSINHYFYFPFSDDESSLTHTTARDTTSRTTVSSSSWDSHYCDDDSTSTLSSTISTLSKSAILYPFSVLYYLTTKLLTVVSFLMFAPVVGAYRVVQNTSSVSSFFHSICKYTV